MDVNSQEWKDKMKKLNEELDKKEGDARHKNPFIRDTIYDKGITSYW
jgi:hypothetical protein